MNKIDGFSKLNNVQFEEKGIRVWRSCGTERGKEISFDQPVLKGEGDNGIIITEKCFPLHDARVYQCSDPLTESSEEEEDWDDSNESMFECSEPGCAKSFQIFSKLESHLDVGDHCLKYERPSERYMTSFVEIGQTGLLNQSMSLKIISSKVKMSQ